MEQPFGVFGSRRCAAVLSFNARGNVFFQFRDAEKHRECTVRQFEVAGGRAAFLCDPAQECGLPAPGIARDHQSLAGERLLQRDPVARHGLLTPRGP
jgi:hypothetical protein